MSDENRTLVNRIKDIGESIEVAVDLAELVNEFSPSNHTERAVAVGYYPDQYHDFENFPINDIDAGYRECQIKKPGNLSYLLRQTADNRGWLIGDGKDGQTQLLGLTGDGTEANEEVIKNEFRG